MNNTALLSKSQAEYLLSEYPCCTLGKGKKFPTYGGWQNKPAKKWAGEGIGILCGQVEGFEDAVYGLDADILNPDAAQEFWKIAVEIIGESELPKRLGFAPKFLIPFTLTNDEPQPFHKESTAEFFDTAGNKNQLEILGQGNQFVAYHIHPDTHKPYVWENASLHELMAFELPSISRNQIAELKVAFISLMAEYNLTAGQAPKLSANQIDDSVFNEADFDDLLTAIEDDKGQLISDSGFTMDDVLAYIPNDETVHYDYWQKILAAVHAASGGVDLGRTAAYKWSKRSVKHTDERFNTTWNSYEKPYHGKKADWGSLIEYAKANGMIEGIKAEELDTLLHRADNIESHAEYEAIKKELTENKFLPNDAREMVAKSLHVAYGKDAGMSLPTLRKAIAPIKGDIVKQHGLFKNWVFIEAQNKYYDLRRGVGIGAQAFRMKFDGHDVVLAAEMDAVTFAAQHNMPTVYDLMFWPGADSIFDYKGISYINSYKPPKLNIPENLNEVQQKTADSFEAHLKFLFPLEADRRIAQDWMAYIIQNPSERIHYALLIKGTEGDGKSYLGNVLDAITNSVNQVAGASLGGQFNSFAHGARVVVIEEVRVTGDKKYESLDRMKPLISNLTLAIEEKGRDIRTVPNHSSYLLFTNHADALPLSKSDRRYAVLETPYNNEDQLFQALGGQDAAAEYFEELFNLLHEAPEAVAYTLLHHKISASFKPKGRAPGTSAKRMMLEATVSMAQEQIEDAIEKHTCDRINADLLDVSYLNNLCVDGFGNMITPLPKTRALSNTLRDMGFVQVEGRRVKIAGEYQYIWYNPMKHTSDSAKDAAKMAYELENFDEF